MGQHSQWSLGQRNYCGTVGAGVVVLLLIALTYYAAYDWQKAVLAVVAEPAKPPSTAVVIPYEALEEEHTANVTVLLRSVQWYCDGCMIRVYVQKAHAGADYVAGLRRWRALEVVETAGSPKLEWKSIVRETLDQYEQVLYMSLPYYMKRPMALAHQLGKFGGYFGSLPKSTRDHELCGTDVQAFKRGALAAEEVLQLEVDKAELSASGARCREVTWGIFGIGSLERVQKETANLTVPFLLRSKPVLNATRELAVAKAKWRDDLAHLRGGRPGPAATKHAQQRLWEAPIQAEHVFLTVLPGSGHSFTQVYDTPLCKHYNMHAMDTKLCGPMPVGDALVQSIAASVKGLVKGGVAAVLGVHESTERQRAAWRAFESKVYEDEAHLPPGARRGLVVRVAFLPKVLAKLPASWTYNYLARYAQGHTSFDTMCVVSPLARFSKHPGWAALETTLTRRTAVFPSEARNAGLQQSACVHRTHFQQYPYLFPPATNFNHSMRWLEAAYRAGQDAPGTIPTISYEVDSSVRAIYPDEVYTGTATLYGTVFNETLVHGVIEAMARETRQGR